MGILFDGKKRPLRGIYHVSPAQELSKKMMLTSLLSGKESIVHNIVSSTSLNQVIEVVEFLGAQTHWVNNTSIAIKSDTVGSIALPKGMLNNLPLYWFAFAVVLAKNGKAAIPFENFIDTHGELSQRIFTLFNDLGVELIQEKGYLIGTLPKDWYEDRPVVMNLPYSYKEETEVAILLSVLRHNVHTTIRNVSNELTIDVLIRFLSIGGAVISRPDPHTIVIEGSEQLDAMEDSVQSDITEAGLIALCTAATGGEVEIRNVEKEGLLPLMTKLDQIGIGYRFDGDILRVWAEQNDPFNPIEIRTGLYPRFSTRWLAPISILLSQCNGESRIIETVDSRGLTFLDILQKAGAVFSVFVPEDFDYLSDFAYDSSILNGEYPSFAAKIFGPTKLTSPSVIDPENTAQSLVGLFLGLMAETPVSMSNAEILTEEYPRMISQLIDLGAGIKYS
ncbi:hypothetical protein HGA91_04910 [candidate division WWE3 bacterium]|nr:hypothetical protein [candidate division WWE3 bacterium]